MQNVDPAATETVASSPNDNEPDETPARPSRKWRRPRRRARPKNLHLDANDDDRSLTEAMRDTVKAARVAPVAKLPEHERQLVAAAGRRLNVRKGEQQTRRKRKAARAARRRNR